MTLKEQINWIRGYLESLSRNENISKEHIKILIDKVEELKNLIYANDLNFEEDDDLPF